MTAPAPVLHHEVLDQLGTRIASGAFRAGSTLTLAGLAAEFGVSRTVVREAVRVLESLGMVESKRRVGVTVQPIQSWQVLDLQVIRWRLAGPGREDQLRALTEMRMAVEPIAARLAAANASTESRLRLVELAGRLRALGEIGEGAADEYLRADIDYHCLLLEASGNEMLAALRGVITEVLSGRTALGLTPAWPAPHSLDDHETAARAVAAGDADLAERHTRAVVMEVFTELDGDEPPQPGPESHNDLHG
jgi:DNA-binding FadR family transcriptional regulator